MANATSDLAYETIGAGGRDFNEPVDGGTQIFAGTMVSQLDATSMLVPTSTALSGPCCGVATHGIDNTAGADDDKRCLILSDRTFTFANGTAGNACSEATPLGAPVYAFDDHTVYDNDGGGTLQRAGYFAGMEPDGRVRVFVTYLRLGDIEASGTPVATGAVNDAGTSGTAARSDHVHAEHTDSVRYVMTTNVANLAAFTVAQDGVTGIAGDLVLLANQTTPAQAGVYVLGTVGGGTAPLTRVSWLPAAAVVHGGYTVHVDEGTLFANTNWFIGTSGAITIGTTSHAWYPESVTQSVTLVAGTATIANVPILSVTKTGFGLVRRVANTCVATDGGYCMTTGGANGVTAGLVGTAAAIIQATVLAGTINNADVSTLNVTVTNR